MKIIQEFMYFLRLRLALENFKRQKKKVEEKKMKIKNRIKIST